MTEASDPLILCIEDEPEILRFLKAALATQGYQFQAAATGKEGLADAAASSPAVVILDLGLPDLDGLEVTRRLRAFSAVPVIVLSARGQERDKVAALDAGADDYLTKPFSMAELLARIRVALRHLARETEPADAVQTYTVRDLTLDVARHRATIGARDVKLTPLEFKLLAELMREAGKVLTHQHLLRRVWGDSYTDQTHYLRVYMAQLRRKIEDDPAQPKYLLTEPGVGYRLADEG
jgi:two-component system, OmpR family, KDP operon response regulator KdpE